MARTTIIVIMNLKCPIKKFVIALLRASFRPRTSYLHDPRNKYEYKKIFPAPTI